MSFADLTRCHHKLKEHKKVGEDKAIMRCERCGNFFVFDYKALTIEKIDIVD